MSSFLPSGYSAADRHHRLQELKDAKAKQKDNIAIKGNTGKQFADASYSPKMDRRSSVDSFASVSSNDSSSSAAMFNRLYSWSVSSFSSTDSSPTPSPAPSSPSWKGWFSKSADS